MRVESHYFCGTILGFFVFLVGGENCENVVAHTTPILFCWGVSEIVLVIVFLEAVMNIPQLEGGFETLASNQLVFSGVVLLIATSALGYLREGLFWVWAFFTHRFMTLVEIHSADEMFQWVSQFLSENPQYILLSQMHRVNVKHENDAARNAYYDTSDLLVMKTPDVQFSPGEGMTLIWFKARLFVLTRSSESNLAAVFRGGNLHSEKLTLYTLGNGKSAVQTLFESAMEYSRQKDKEKTVVFILDDNSGSGWMRALSKPKRSIDSVILRDKTADEIRKDAAEFLASSEWYRRLGVPYRRSYLLYGRPGCGKTSFVTALAGELNLNVCVLSLNRPYLTDDAVNSYLRSAPPNAIILLEDIDVAFPTREASQKAMRDMSNAHARTSPNVTFSGILNAIDGIASQEGRIFIMTTNSKDELDPAIMRPGRVDIAAEFKLASPVQAEQLFLRFYPDEADLSVTFGSHIVPDLISMAALQGLFMMFKTDPLGAVNAAPQLVSDTKESLRKEEEAKKKRQEKEDSAKKRNKGRDGAAVVEEESSGAGVLVDS